MDNQINEIMTTAIEKIKSVAESNTVIGVPFESKDGTLIFPLTKVSLGFVAGGGEYGTVKQFKESNRYPFAGGSGAGVTLQPVGLLKVKEGDVKLIHIDDKSPVEKILETIPEVIDNLAEMLKKDKEK